MSIKPTLPPTTRGISGSGAALGADGVDDPQQPIDVGGDDQREPTSPGVSQAKRAVASQAPGARRIQQALGVASPAARPATIAKVRSSLEAAGLPVGKDPSRIDDPITKASIEKAIGKDKANALFAGDMKDMDLEALLSLLEAKEADKRPPPPPPRPAPSAPRRGMSGSGAPASSPSSSASSASSATSASTAAAKPARDPDAAQGKTVTVKKATTVEALAKEHNVNPALLRAANPALPKSGVIAAGTKVHIPGVDAKADPMASSSPLKAGASGAGDTGAVSTNSAFAQAQMKGLLDVAKQNATGKQPGGKCLAAVQDYLDQTKFGDGKVARMPEAHNYADFLNQGDNAKKMGLQKLNIDNPYDAPPGAIVVVRAGTPGTSHPTAGDITVKGEGDKFYNDGEMGYGGRQNFPKGNDFVLGVYVPTGGAGQGAAGSADSGPVAGVPGALKKGDSSDDVKTLQQKLTERGFPAGDSGTFDDKTASAVAAFNQQNGIDGADASQATQRALHPTAALYEDAKKDRDVTVKAGDTVDAIAQQNNVSVALLRQANPSLDKSSSLTAGEKLHIPAVDLEKAPGAAYDATAAAQDPTAQMGTDTKRPAGAVPPANAGLPDVKAADRATFDPLAAGDKGDKVTALQTQLKARGYDVGEDGKYDAKTAAAVNKFNQQQGLPDGDAAGQATLGALNATTALFGKGAAPLAASGSVDVANWKPGPNDVTPEDLQKIVPGLSADKAREVAPHLNAAMAEAKINTPERKAQFISQLAHESGGFMYDEEIASGAAYEGRSDLGNTQPGDGERFKGRGYIQLTGRANYEAAGKDLGLDLANHPELASQPENASRVAAWYWNKNNINQLADSGDVTAVTRAINGGTNGLASREAYYERARTAVA